MKTNTQINILAIILFFITLEIHCNTSVNTKYPKGFVNILNRETKFDRIVDIHKGVVWNIRKVKSWDQIYDLQGKYINIGNCRLWVVEEGKGVPVVLIQGGPGENHSTFTYFFNKAKNFARIIYYDQRGTGKSDYVPGKGYSVEQAVSDLEELREALKIKEWVVLGWSYGGLLAQLYAIKYPEHVLGMILVGASTGLKEEYKHDYYEYLSKIEKEKIADVTKQILARSEDEKWPFDKILSIVLYNRWINGDWKRQMMYKPTDDEFLRMALYYIQYG